MDKPVCCKYVSHANIIMLYFQYLQILPWPDNKSVSVTAYQDIHKITHIYYQILKSIPQYL